MRNLSRRALSIAMSFVLVAGLCPGLAYADEGGGGASRATGALAAAPGFDLDGGGHAGLSAQSALMTQAAAVDEVEPNDDFDSATSIPMNAYVYGTGDGGNDYYQFNLPQSGTVKMTFVNGKYSSDTPSFDYRVYDGYYDEVNGLYGFAYTTSTRPVTETWNLKQGVNRLRIWGSEGQPYHFKLSYVIPTTTVKKVTKAPRAFTVKWAKKAGAAKYQLRYATRKNMSDAKLVDVSSASSSRKVTGLKSKQKYFAQVRVVKVIDGETYYSPWSNKKSVKTK